jgi:hypothetical protein
MNRLNRNVSLGLSVLGLVLLSGYPLSAFESQPGKANWDNVKQVLPNEQVRVVMNDGKSYRGLIETASDTDMKIRIAAGDQTFAREDVSRVSVKTTSSRGSHAAEGAGIGFLGGFALFTAATANPLAGVVGGLILGTPAGAVIGAVLPARGWHDVYRVPKNAKEQPAKASSGNAQLTRYQ